MQWKHPSSPPPKNTKVVSSAGKVMASVFWDAKGIVFIDYLQRGQTINGGIYLCQLAESAAKVVLWCEVDTYNFPCKIRHLANLSQDSCKSATIRAFWENAAIGHILPIFNPVILNVLFQYSTTLSKLKVLALIIKFLKQPKCCKLLFSWTKLRGQKRPSKRAEMLHQTILSRRLILQTPTKVNIPLVRTRRALTRFTMLCWETEGH